MLSRQPDVAGMILIAVYIDISMELFGKLQIVWGNCKLFGKVVNTSPSSSKLFPGIAHSPQLQLFDDVIKESTLAIMYSQK
jgi:hypothetical protein